MLADGAGQEWSAQVSPASITATVKQVEAWREHRFVLQSPVFEVQVLDASGHVAPDGTLLTTVRDTYREG